MKVLITGSRAQLAGALVEAFADAEVLALTRAECDITQPDVVRQRSARFAPDVIVNCASYNHVDRAEEEAEQAIGVNSLALRSLARAAQDAHATLVHYSTDFVFDGVAAEGRAPGHLASREPYTEDDLPNPQGVYAASKLMGESFAREAPRAFVVRVESLFGGTPAKSSIDRIIDAVTQRAEARVFRDRVVSPSYVVDVAQATRQLIAHGAPGLYHCVNAGRATWLEVGQEIARLLGESGSARLVPISVDDLDLPAPRPQHAALSSAKLAAAGIQMPTWQDAVGRYLRARKRGSVL